MGNLGARIRRTNIVLLDPEDDQGIDNHCHAAGESGGGDGETTPLPRGPQRSTCTSCGSIRNRAPRNIQLDDSSSTMYLALYDFETLQDDDLRFKKGDKLEKINTDDESDWIICKNLRTEQVGYVPINYVQLHSNTSVEEQEWWNDLCRQHAESWLTQPGIGPGTFLVRYSRDRTNYALSIRCPHDIGESHRVLHYKAMSTSTGKIYIGKRKQFSSILELVNYYKRKADGIPCRLTEACPRTPPIPPMRSIEVNPSSVTKLEKLGEGYYGEVWKGVLAGQGNVAIKILKPGRMTADELMQEAKTMNMLRHPRLVKIVGVCTTTEPVQVITEYMAKGSLINFLRNEGRPLIDFKTVIQMTGQIAEGMAFLESQNVIHRDLRAGNILVAESLDVKISDFGLTREGDVEGNYLSTGSRFPIKWSAPEAVEYSSFSIKSDVWSFGIVMYEIVTLGRQPYAGMNSKEAFHAVQTGYRLHMPVGRWTQEEIEPYYLIMKQCWKLKPMDRPTFYHLQTTFEDFDISTEEQYKDV